MLNYRRVHQIAELQMVHLPGREQIGVHTCDRRSSRTDYVESFPKVDVSHVKHDEERIWVMESKTCSSNNSKMDPEYTLKFGRHMFVFMLYLQRFRGICIFE